MIFNKVRTIIVFGLILSIFIAGCKREKTNWDADFTLPLAFAKLTTKNLINDSLISADTSNAITFVYTNKIDGLAGDVITIPDTTVKYTYQNFLSNFALPSGTLLPTLGNNLDFNLETVKLKKAKLISGNVLISAKNYARVPIKTTFSVPNAKLNNVPLLSINTIPGKSNGLPGQLSTSIPLDNYELELFNPSTNTYNSLSQSVSFAIGNNTSLDTIFFFDSVIVNIKFSKLEPDYATGYFGKLNQTFTNGPTLFNFKDILDADQIQLQKANLDFKFKNFIGVDIRAEISNFIGSNSSTNTTTNLRLKNNSPIRLNLTSAASNSPNYDLITPFETNYSFNTINSNIVDFLNNLPDELSLAGKFTFNPLGVNINNFSDFYKRNKLIETEYKISIPGSFSFKNLKIKIDGEIDIKENDLDQFKSGNLTLYSKNYFPYQIQLQGYFLNDNGQIVDSIFSKKATIDAAIDSPIQGLLSPVQNKNVYTLNSVQKDLLKVNKKIRWIGLLNTRDNKIFEIKADYAVELKLVADAIVNLKYD